MRRGIRQRIRRRLRPFHDPDLAIPLWFFFTPTFLIALWWNVAAPVYAWLYAGGLIDLQEGGYYRDATIAPLGTKPRPWSRWR